MSGDTTVSKVLVLVERMIDALEPSLAAARALGAEVLGVIQACPQAQWDDLQAGAKLMCDNLSREVAIYSFFGEITRALEPHIPKGPFKLVRGDDSPGAEELNAWLRFSILKLAVLGD